MGLDLGLYLSLAAEGLKTELDGSIVGVVEGYKLELVSVHSQGLYLVLFAVKHFLHFIYQLFKGRAPGCVFLREVRDAE